MRASTRRVVRFTAFLSLLALAGLAPDARAEADAFGIGDGHDGPKTAVGDEVVNTYAPLTADAAAGATTLAFGALRGAAPGFAAGDLVLVWRATGATTADAQDAGNAGSRFTKRVDLAVASAAPPALGPVGTWELARVQTAAAGTLTLTKPLARSFAKDVTQLVRIPEYTTVDVPTGASLKALPWAASGAGFSGGILAFLANGTVTLTGNLDADAAGFRGGEKVQRLLNLAAPCTAEDGTPADGFADKGEGLVPTEYGPAKGGRGNWSLAAGGGNCQESGGGGGGNRGNGGSGGDSFLSTGRGGRGGVGIDYSLLDRMTMGGGGGAGEQKNGVGSAGGSGGGVVFVRALSMSGAGKFTALGGAAANATALGLESDGAGGGGAGGSILIRTVKALDCGGLVAKGGKGGDTAVVTLGLFGPGGGGGGGRVLVQSQSVSGTCIADVSAGAPGSSGGVSNGATGGVAGAPDTPPAGPFCFSNPDVSANAQCADPKPVCNVAEGACVPCDGGKGTLGDAPCPFTTEPVCAADGACVPCARDLGNAGDGQCQSAGAPTCFTTGADAGSCAKCTSDTDCVGATHNGPKCAKTAGACGIACKADADCPGSQWCAEEVCIPKTPNEQPVTPVAPYGGECTPEAGRRTCLSGVCEEDDDLCGLDYGSDCGGVNERCRVNICWPDDRRCGKPAGAPCARGDECRNENCEAGVCVGCDDDTDCLVGQKCDVAQNTCVPDPNAGDGGVTTLDTSGLIEGGGCACSTTSLATAASPLALFGFAAAGVLAARRRSRRPR